MGRGSGAGRGRGGSLLDNMSPFGFGACMCTTAVVLITGVVLFATSFQVVKPWEYGLHFNRLTVKIERERVYGGGRYMKGPGHRFVKYPRRNVYIEFSNSADGGANNLPIDAWSRDGQSISLEVGFYFKLLPERMHDLYFLYDQAYVPVIEDIARQTLRNVATQFDTISFFTERDVINDAMFESFASEVERVVGAQVPVFFILSIDVPDGFEGAVEDKVVVAQEKVVLEVEREASVIRQTIDVVQANSSRTVSVINANATAQGTVTRKAAKAEAARLVGNMRAEQYNETAHFLGFVDPANMTDSNGTMTTTNVPDVHQVLQLIYSEFVAGEDTGGALARLFVNYPSLLVSPN